MSRTRKRPYTKSKAIDPSCRCHGGCPVCTGNRLYAQHRADEAQNDEIDDFFTIPGSTCLAQVGCGCPDCSPHTPAGV